MPKNYLIGIGGTGARVIEATVNLCAAGFGPDELSVFIIDPDAGNGNLTRTKNLITNYIKCRNTLQKTDNTNIFKTKINIPPDSKLVWEIFSDKGKTLAEYINYTNMPQTKPDLANFVSLLFTEKELTTPLDEGFRGHPSIGSVVMANPDLDKYPFKMLFDDLAGSKKANDVRVFLVGSVFGGTGAAGFPTLGSKNLIKYHPSATISENVSQVLLGGALVLPYFSFDLDPEAERSEKMFVTTNDFPIATKAALQYYNEKDLGFDQIYMIGDSLSQKVGSFGVGSKKQENFPHYIEIVTSLAAFDFFEQPEIKETSEKMYFTAIRENDKIDWAGLPVSRDPAKIRSKQMELKTALTTMTLFSYIYLTYGRKILNTNHKDLKQPWYTDHFKFNEKDEKEKEKDPRQKPGIDVLDDFQNALNDFIFWISAIDDNSGKVELIDKKMLISGEMELGKSFKLFDPENDITKNNLSQLVKNEKSKEWDFNRYLNKFINDVIIKDKRITEASSKYINIFYESALNFCKSNYKVN